MRRNVLKVAAVLVALVAGGTAATEMGRYLVRAAWEEGKILARRRDIADVITDSLASAAVRRRLALVQHTRRFAAEGLRLTTGQSFTQYSSLDRDTLVLVLSAARRDTLVGKSWWFPVVGRFPYKGFFNFAAARREERALRAQGWDTYLRPASAFSTLGWFNDPLLSTTLRLDTLDLVNTVIHELVHNTVFIKNHVAFNESFASFVGARGAQLFFQGRGQAVAAARVAARWEDEKQLATFWAVTAAKIDSGYALGGDSLTRIARRDSIYVTMRRVLLADLGPRMPTVPRRVLERMVLDNAALLARRVYASELWLFDEFRRRHGGTLSEVTLAIGRLSQNAEQPFQALHQATKALSPP